VLISKINLKKNIYYFNIFLKNTLTKKIITVLSNILTIHEIFHPLFKGDHFRFDSVFIKKITKPNFFLKKPKSNQNQLKFFRTKPVQTGLAWFFRFDLVFYRFSLVFFGLSSVWLGFSVLGL